VVTSLDDIASPEAQADFQELLNTLVGSAQQHLAKHGEFFPFAAAVRVDGDVRLVYAMPNPDDDRSPSNDVIDACYEALASARNANRSAAIVCDVRLRPPLDGDALRIDFEHMDGAALVALLPYSEKPGSAIEYGDLSIMAGRHRIWP
jgi:hypothetical protein